MTILITGSSGKTSRRLADILRQTHPILIASRAGKDVEGSPGVKFDWSDSSTYSNPYSHPQAKNDPIRAIYLVNQPGCMAPLEIMKPFIDTALANNVQRYVLLSAIREDETTPGTGQVHKYLKELGVEWCVLRPTWFMENFSEQQHLPTIRDQSSIFSAAGDGSISFISTEDIAAVASRALTDTEAHNRDYILVGPELITHDEAATIFTEALSCQIRHIRVTEEELVAKFMDFGVPESYARRISGGEVRASRGEFAILNETVSQVTGRPARTLRAYVEKHKSVWR